jgi:hypothetical protein
MLCLLAYCFEASHRQYYKIMLESLLIELGFVMNTNEMMIRRALKQEVYRAFHNVLRDYKHL